MTSLGDSRGDGTMCKCPASTHMVRTVSAHMVRLVSTHMVRLVSAHMVRPVSTHMVRPVSSHMVRPLFPYGETGLLPNAETCIWSLLRVAPSAQKYEKGILIIIVLQRKGWFNVSHEPK